MPFVPPRRLMELALAGDRVTAYHETGMSLDRVIQQAVWLAENEDTSDCADLATRLLAARDQMRAQRSAGPLRG